MVSEPMLPGPAAVGPVTGRVLVPAVRGTEMDAVAQVSQLAVGGKFSVPREVPLTEMVAGRAAVVPSEYRTLWELVLAVSAVTWVSKNASTELVVLAEPVPVNPRWLKPHVPPA